MKKIGLLFIALLGVLGLVVVYGFMTLESRQIEGASFEVEVDEEDVLARFSGALKYPTVANKSEHLIERGPFLQFNEYLRKSYPLFFNTTESVPSHELTLVQRWPGQIDCPPNLVMSHTDVVPVEGNGESWSEDPFAGVVKDGYVWGRGTLDVKNGVMSLLEAASLLMAEGFRPQCDLYFSFGHDEEVGGMNGNLALAKQFEKNDIRFASVLDEGGLINNDLVDETTEAIAFVGVGEKGYATYKLTSTDEGGHSSMPGSTTAVGRLARAASRLEDNKPDLQMTEPVQAMLSFLGPELPPSRRAIFGNLWLFQGPVLDKLASTKPGNATVRTTTAVTMFTGGVAENVLPKSAESKVNFRLLPGDTTDRVENWIKSVIQDESIEVEMVMGFNPPPVSSVDSKQFKKLQRAIADSFNDVIVVPNLTIAATDSRHFAPVAEQIFRFNPMRIDNADLKRIHGTDERISVASYLTGIKFYYRYMQLLGSPSVAR